MTAFPPVPRVCGFAIPLMRANIDTDAIIPSREIKGVGKTGLADGLFAGWRYTSDRIPNPDFILNQRRYTDAPILLGGANFGCGSSREHAVWALHEYGIRAIIAPSFAPIFQSNCVRNGIIPVAIDPAVAAAWQGEVTIDLMAQTVSYGPDTALFSIDPEAKAMLAGGLDAIDLTSRYTAEIDAFLARDRAARPWIYLESLA